MVSCFSLNITYLIRHVYFNIINKRYNSSHFNTRFIIDLIRDYIYIIVVRERPMLISPWCFSANEFPSSFESIVRKILRLLYHVVAHIYHCHFREVALLGLHAHLNCVFAHLTLLNQRFNLIDPKETEILGDLEAALLGKFYTLSSRPSSLSPMRYWSMPITQCRREIRDWIARFKRRNISFLTINRVVSR